MNKKQLFVAVTVIIVITASLFVYLNSPANNAWKIEGPQFSVQANFTGAGGQIVTPSSALPHGGSIDISIVSEVPFSAMIPHSVNLSSAPVMANGYEDVLFQGASNAASFNGNLTPEFYTIASSWAALIPLSNDLESLALFADYQYVNGSDLYIYHYYNTIPYDPHSMVFQTAMPDVLLPFHLKLYFNLSSPSLVLPFISYENDGQTPAQSPSITYGGIIGGGGGNCTDMTQVINSTSFYGPLPISQEIFPVHDNGSSLLSASYLTNSNSVKESLNFTATEVYNQKSVLMSSSPSFGTKDLQIMESLFGMLAAPQKYENASMLYMQNVTWALSLIKTTYFAYTSGACGYYGYTYNFYQRIVAIKGTQNNTVDVFLHDKANNTNNFPGWNKLATLLDLGSTFITEVNDNNQKKITNVEANISGYNNATQAEQQATDSFESYVLNGFESTAIDAVLGLIPYIGGLISSAYTAYSTIQSYYSSLKVNFSIANAITSIMVWVNSNLNLTNLWFVNFALAYNNTTGSNVNVYALTGATSTLQINGNAYTFTAPADVYEIEST